jgi:hypothetical protein
LLCFARGLAWSDNNKKGETPMKVASLALAIAVVTAGAALAKPTDVPRSGSHDAHARSAHAQVHAQAPAAKTDPFGAYMDGKEIGRDPDPNIREELRNEYLWGG